MAPSRNRRRRPVVTASTMRTIVLGFWLLQLVVLFVQGFPLVPRRYRSDACSRAPVTVSPTAPMSSTIIKRRMGNMDYEYIPPNPFAVTPFSTNLDSVYPPGTPAGLRGEAVRSALRSTRCLAWDLSNSPLATGLLSVEGKGTVDFLQSKFSQSFQSSETNTFQQACLLDAKGKLVDLVGVIQASPTKAYLVTSPGHTGSALYKRIDPLVFPMDQITLKDCTATTRLVSIASTRIEHVQQAIRTYVEPILDLSLVFPSSDSECTTVSLGDDTSDTSMMMIVPTVNLPSCACIGYTLVFLDMSQNTVPARVWNALVGDDSPEGPIQVGPLDYETLRIQTGMPAFGKEMTAAEKSGEGEKRTTTPAGPLEVHWQSYLDLDKGCYLGQEGVASVVKNPRGPPRLLYSVNFFDQDNLYQHQSEGEMSSRVTQRENLTTLPRAGQELFVLGSNEQISVGTLTSIAEPGGTGDPEIVGLALIKRADSVLKQMKSMDLEADTPSLLSSLDSEGSGIIQPPPLDSLDGLEVIVGGSFTIGKLRVLPNRRYRPGQNMFEDVELVEPPEGGSVMGYMKHQPTELAKDETLVPTPRNTNVDNDDKDTEATELEKAMEDAAKAEKEAQAAAAEAQRKAEKMEMLKRRAEEAMARRKNKSS